MFCNCRRCDTSIKHVNPRSDWLPLSPAMAATNSAIESINPREVKKNKNPGTFSFILFAFISRVNLPSPLHPFELNGEKMAKEQQLRSICRWLPSQFQLSSIRSRRHESRPRMTCSRHVDALAKHCCVQRHIISSSGN